MTKNKTALLGIALLSVFLFVRPLLAETKTGAKSSKEKKQEEIKAALRKQQEQEEAIKRKREHDRQIERIVQQNQFILDHQRRVEDALERANFATAIALLKKGTFEVGENIDVEYVLKNGAKKAFLIDGRKLSPTFVVKDQKGTTILTLGKNEKQSLPKNEELIKLEPKETFVPLKGEPFSLSKPGKYTVLGSYTFLRPAEDNPHVWFGTLKTYTTSFEVVEKKAKK